LTLKYLVADWWQLWVSSYTLLTMFCVLWLTRMDCNDFARDMAAFSCPWVKTLVVWSPDNETVQKEWSKYSFSSLFPMIEPIRNTTSLAATTVPWCEGGVNQGLHLTLPATSINYYKQVVVLYQWYTMPPSRSVIFLMGIKPGENL
jgi:hypothetical protein